MKILFVMASASADLVGILIKILGEGSQVTKAEDALQASVLVGQQDFDAIVVYDMISDEAAEAVEIIKEKTGTSTPVLAWSSSFQELVYTLKEMLDIQRQTGR
jgi:DNA-binding response OmpR family regulator